MVKRCRVILGTERDWRRVRTTPTTRTVMATSSSRAAGAWFVFLSVVMMVIGVNDIDENDDAGDREKN